MLQLKNQTPFKATMGLFPNEQGIDCVYGVLKATFHFGPDEPRLAPEQRPLALMDEHWGDPKNSSLKQASDISLTKPSTDIVVYGHAYAPASDRRMGEVRVKVGAVSKTVRVFGDRKWQQSAGGWRMSEPQEFEKIPLKYELAFGGADGAPKDPAKVDYEARNPVGCGLFPKGSQASPKEVPLPNFETPAQLIRSTSDRPAPAGLGPVCGHWEPRKGFAGTYDALWQKKRAPYLPSDFNPRFHQMAPADLIAPSYLRGGERVELSGVMPGGGVGFELPRTRVEMVFHFDGQPVRYPAALDTVSLYPDQQTVCLVWRACHVVDKWPHRLTQLEMLASDGSAGNGGARDV